MATSVVDLSLMANTALLCTHGATTKAGEDERFPLHAQGGVAVRARIPEHGTCVINALVSHTERADV